MADDELEDDFDPEAVDEDLDEEELDEDTIDAEELDDEAEVLVEGSEEITDEDDEDEAVEEVSVRAKKRREDDEDDEDELDPDDVEADLDTILKDRIAAADEEEDEDELEEAPRATPEAPDGVVPKKANEFVCTGCFLLVNRGQFGPESDMQCPVGESECPAIEQLRGPAPAKAAKPARKR